MLFLNTKYYIHLSWAIDNPKIQVLFLEIMVPDDKTPSTLDEQPDFKKILLATAAGIFILGGITYVGYKYSQKKSTITLPGGVTYLGPTPQGESQPTAPLQFAVDPTTSWLTMTGKSHGFTFSYPSTLPLVVYSGDTTDTISIGWGNIPPQQNIIINVSDVSDLDPKYIPLPREQYVKDWWKQYSGLKGLKSITPFTNPQNIKGFRARYFDWSDNAPIDNVFYPLPNNSHYVIHLANGVLEPSVFDRIVNSIVFVTPTQAPTLAPKPTVQTTP